MNHNHASEAACETIELALRRQSHAGLRRRMARYGWHGWRADRYRLRARRTAGDVFRRPFKSRKAQLNLDWGPDARPKIALDRKGDIAVAFSTFRDKAFNGEVFYSRSSDGGKTFAPPRPITDNTESQRFEALGFDADGTLFAAWLDKRNRVPGNRTGKKYDGAALFFATSKDGGATYAPAEMAVDNTCECCRLGLAFDPCRPSRGRVSGTSSREASEIMRS